MTAFSSVNYTNPHFPLASAALSGLPLPMPYRGVDFENLAAALDGHDHSYGKGLTIANREVWVEDYRQGTNSDWTTLNLACRAMDATGGTLRFPPKTYSLLDRLKGPAQPTLLRGAHRDLTKILMDAATDRPILVDSFSDYLWQAQVPPGGTPRGPGYILEDITFDGQKTGAYVANIPNIWLTGGYSDLFRCIVNGSAWHGVLFGDPSGNLPANSMTQCNVILCKFGNCLGSSIYNDTQCTAGQFRWNTIEASGFRHFEVNGGAFWFTDNICAKAGLQGVLARLSGGQACVARNDIRDGLQTMIEMTITQSASYQAGGIRCDDNDLGVDLLDTDNNYNGIYIHQDNHATAQLDAVSCRGNNIYRVHFASDPHPTWKLANGIAILGQATTYPGATYVDSYVDPNAANTRLNVFPGATVVDAQGVAPLRAVVGGRFAGAQGLAVASANNLTLGGDGNYFPISGAVQINGIDNTGWPGGAIVTLKFASTPTVKHNNGSGNFKKIMLNGSADLVAAANTRLVLEYDGVDSAWYEIGRTVA